MRQRRPEIPIIDYVSPSVWAWRPGRARKMRGYVDHVLALLPFEPDAHQRLGGPPCTYVGHPLIERLPWIAALDTAPLAQRLALPPDTPLLVVLPGSRPRRSSRLMQPFGEALTRLIERGRKFEVVIPVVESVRGLIEQHLPAWPKQPASRRRRGGQVPRLQAGARGVGRLGHGDAGAGRWPARRWSWPTRSMR